jgi:hypothetical protein
MLNILSICSNATFVSYFFIRVVIKLNYQNATVSEKIGTPIEKAKKGAKSIPVAHKDVIAHFSDLVPHFN